MVNAALCEHVKKGEEGRAKRGAGWGLQVMGSVTIP